MTVIGELVCLCACVEEMMELILAAAVGIHHIRRHCSNKFCLNVMARVIKIKYLSQTHANYVAIF